MRGRLSESKRFVSPACVCTVAVSIPSVLVTFIYPAIISLQGTLQCKTSDSACRQGASFWRPLTVSDAPTSLLDNKLIAAQIKLDNTISADSCKPKLSWCDYTNAQSPTHR